MVKESIDLAAAAPKKRGAGSQSETASSGDLFEYPRGGSFPSRAQAKISTIGMLRATLPSTIHRRRTGDAQRVRTFQYLQRTVGNGAIARSLRQLPPKSKLEIQRDISNPLDWASDLLQRVTGNAANDEAQVRGEASDKATQITQQGTDRSNDLQDKLNQQSASLQKDATDQSTQISTQADTQGHELQNQGSAESTQLNSESGASGTAIQQDAAHASTKLQSDVGSLDTQTRAHVGEASNTVSEDIGRLHGEGESTDGQIKSHWTGLEQQTSARVKTATNQTQSLVDNKNSLVQEFQSGGAHDPNNFQKRWAQLQEKVSAAEHGEPGLRQAADAGGPVTAQANSFWSRITNQGQAVLGKVTSLAAGAWAMLQNRWTALQNVATQALQGVRQRADAAIARIKTLATAAWTKLQNLAGQAWNTLRDLATRAWNGLKSRGAAAWAALAAAATAAWTALQTAANSIISALSSKVASIINKINGALGSIVKFLASAISSLISRVRSVTDAALSYLKSRASAAWDALRSVGNRVWQSLKETAESAWTGLKDLGTRAWNGLKDLGTKIWTNLKALGTRLWSALQSLAKRAWDMLGKAWEWLKKKAEAAWQWAKKAWSALKSAALKAWDWLKRTARAALEWLKRKWAWLKAMISKAIAWLKAKWKWLKSIVKITIRIPDITLVKRQNLKPWKFVDLDSGRIPFAKTVVDTPAGPLELAALARAQADATISGWICPCILKNIRITLQPLISRYTGQADLHIPGNIQEGVSVTGTIGGSGNLGGAVGILEGGLKATGTARGFGSLVISPRIVYDSGKVSLSERFRLEFCINPIIGLDAFARLVATTAAPPSSGRGGGGKTPMLPPGPMGGSTAMHGTSAPPVATGPGAKSKKPKEKILWEGNWHIGSISKIECWKIGAKYTLTFAGGVPELDIEFDTKQVSVGEVIRKILADIKPTGGGKGPSVGPTAKSCRSDPGDCTTERCQELQAEVNKRCKTVEFRCRKGESCKETKSKMRRGQKCAAARDEINDECYKGGDKEHKEQAEAARRAAERCRDLIKENC